MITNRDKHEELAEVADARRPAAPEASIGPAPTAAGSTMSLCLRTSLVRTRSRSLPKHLNWPNRPAAQAAAGSAPALAALMPMARLIRPAMVSAHRLVGNRQ